MRVLIDTTYAIRAPLSGTGVYIRAVCDQLRLEQRLELIEVSNPRRRPPAGGGLGSARNLLSDLWWTSVELPRLAGRRRAALIHHPLPAWAPVAPAAQIITVHDVAFELLPECFDAGYRRFAHLSHRAAARRAARVLCNSHSTGEDVRRLWGVPAERITVAPLGPGQELELLEGSGAEHFLYVGDDQPRKNLGVLLAAYERYRGTVERPLPLVLAGSATAGGDGVRVERRPSPRRLAELYRDAVALVHPALHEGFGMTPLEAMRLGVPVLASRVPGVSEVCGEAARYVEPADAAGYGAAMTELAGDPVLRAHFGELGRRRAAEFSWARCARATAAAYSLVSGL